MKTNKNMEKHRQALRERLSVLESEKSYIELEKERLYNEYRIKSKELDGHEAYKLFKDIIHDIIKKSSDVQKKIDNIRKDLLEKKYANLLLYTDIEPYEVVEEMTPNLYIVRPMKAVQTKESIEKIKESFIPGGFFGHFENDLQEWIIAPDEEADTIRIRRHKDGVFYDTHGGRYAISDKPVKKYDFNF